MQQCLVVAELAGGSIGAARLIAALQRPQPAGAVLQAWNMYAVLLAALTAAPRATLLQGLEHALQQDGVAGQHDSPAELFDRWGHGSRLGTGAAASRRTCCKKAHAACHPRLLRRSGSVSLQLLLQHE